MSDHETAKPVVYFHIGAPKTGTTFIQRVLWQNRDSLRKAGVLYPGDSFGAHVHAAFDLRKSGFQGYQDPRTSGAWSDMVAQAREWNGPVILSQELFSPASRAQIDTALEDLSFADVHLLYTARDLTRQIPAAWQEDLKNRFKPTFDEFVAVLRHPQRDPTGLGRMFWRMQDAPEVLGRWGHTLAPDHVHVITVPTQADPPDLLWKRFASVVGIDPGTCDTSEAFTNTSFLRRLNLALDDEVGWPLYNEMVKHYLAQDVLAQRAHPRPTTLRPEDAVWAEERAGRIADGLASAGYDVIGTLDDLRPSKKAVDADLADSTPTAEEQLDIAIEALAAVLLRVSRLRRKVISR